MHLQYSNKGLPSIPSNNWLEQNFCNKIKKKKIKQKEKRTAWIYYANLIPGGWVCVCVCVAYNDGVLYTYCE